jgi:uncharacterized protein (TIGR04255 family)
VLSFFYLYSVKSMEDIKFCKNSTITEAWFTLQGVPAKFEPDEIGSINTAAKRRIPHLLTIPTLLVRSESKSLEPAFWSTNFSWNNGQFQSRIGHKYLSVHTICSSEKKYVDYTSTMKPQIELWLDIVSKQVQDPVSFQIGSITYGYINTFEFPSKGFDISSYFRVNLGIEIESLQEQVSSLNSNFNFYDSKKNLNVRVSIEVIPSPSNSKNLMVRTHVSSELINPPGGININENLKILNKCSEIKDSSKRVFFGFATKKTKSIMEAKS